MNKTISCNDEIGPDDLRGRFLETVADIAYQAGVIQFYSGDSRADATMFINWAREFEKSRVWSDGKESYFGKTYMDAIEEFTEAKLRAAVEALP